MQWLNNGADDTTNKIETNISIVTKKPYLYAMNWNNIKLQQFISIRADLHKLVKLEQAYTAAVTKADASRMAFVESLPAGVEAVTRNKQQAMTAATDAIESIQSEMTNVENSMICTVTGLGMMDLMNLKQPNYKQLVSNLHKLLQTQIQTQKINKFNINALPSAKRGIFSKGKNATFKIRDIWEHSSLLNQQYQIIAGEMAKRVQNEDWSLLPFLVAALTADNDLDLLVAEKRTGTKAEKMQQFIKIAKPRAERFKDMAATDAVGVFNFFLTKWDR